MIFEAIGQDSGVEDDGPGQVSLDGSGELALVVEIHLQVHVLTQADLQRGGQVRDRKLLSPWFPPLKVNGSFLGISNHCRKQFMFGCFVLIF